MALAFVQASSNQSTTVTTTVTLATAPISGNSLVAMVSGLGLRTYTTPTGWAILTPRATLGTCSEIAYWKIADGTEGTSLAFTGNLGSANGAMVYEISGASTTAPVASLTNATASSAVTFTSSTPTVANSMAIEFAAPAINGTTVTVPTGYTGQTQNANNHCPRGAYKANLPISDASTPCTLGAAVDWASLIVIIAPAASSTVYSSANTAGLSFVGAQAKAISRAQAAALAFVGAQSKTILRAQVAALSFIGAQTKAIARAQSGALSFTGTFAAIKSPVHAFTATLSFIGASTKRSARGFSGALSFTGAQSKTAIRPFTAALTTSGAFVRSATRSFTAGVSFSAISTAVKATTSSLTFTASQSKIVSRALTASLTPRGAIGRAASRVLTASTSFAGSKSIAITRALTASVTPTGAQTSRVSLRYAHADAGALSFAATLTIQYVPVGSIVIIIGNGSYAGNNGNGASVTNQGNG